MARADLNEQAKEIIAIAERHGVEQNFFFLTCFKRYQVQLNILNELQKELKGDVMITKEYVKGRGNIYTHPAIKEFNSTSMAANQTVVTLMKIIEKMRGDKSGQSDELLNFLKGLGD